jgi:hypothetical protein
MSEPTMIFGACVEAISNVMIGDGHTHFAVGDEASSITRTVIQTIIDRTQSARTVDELTEILAEADA